MKHGYLISPKNQSNSPWNGDTYPVKVNAKYMLSKRKIMATVFWDWCGVLLVDFMPQKKKEQRSTQVPTAQLCGSSEEHWETNGVACCQKDRLTKEQNEFAITLKTLEESLLSRLSEAEGNLVGDVTLVESLESTKAMAAEIQAKSVESHRTESEINVAREIYRDVADRAALVYFVVQDLVTLSPMYLFSLKAHVIHHSKGLDVRLSLAATLSLIQVTVNLAQFHPNFEGEHPGGGSRASHLSSPSTNLARRLAARRLFRLLNGYLEYPHAENAPYIYKHPCLLQDSNPGPTTQQSASLITIPDGRQQKWVTNYERTVHYV
ncbi:dynein heavy chain 17, axonemal [Trichonephila clavipes]|nr:dynein heavy chain 17, axonemal [Trichonephila clavipes]